jgi:hypothetical protein
VWYEFRREVRFMINVKPHWKAKGEHKIVEDKTRKACLADVI